MKYIIELYNSITDIYPSLHYLTLIVFAFLMILISQLISWTAKKFLLKLRNKESLLRTNSTIQLHIILIDAGLRPLTMGIKYTGLLVALSIISLDIKNDLFQTLISYGYVVFIPLISWFFMGITRSYEKVMIQKIEQEDDPSDITTIQAVTKLIRLSILIITILIVLQNVGINISALAAAGGVSGLAIGFAAKDLLANFFGGLMLYMEKPFKVGDWIRSPDREIEGTVTDIGLRSTSILTFDRRPLYVPNSVFSQIAIENPSRMRNRRIYETIGLRYQDINQVENIVKQVKQYLQESKHIDKKHTLMVNFNKFSNSSLDFFIYCFTHTIKWQEFHQIKEEVLLKVSEIISQNNADIAFPTSTLHLINDGTTKQELPNNNDKAPPPSSV